MKDYVSVLPEAFYDLIGIILPGITFLISLNTLNYQWLSEVNNININSVSVFFIAGYLIGHMFYALSSVFFGKFASRYWIHPRLELITKSEGSKKKKLPSKGLKGFISDNMRKTFQDAIKKKWDLPIDFSENPMLYYEMCRNYIHIKDKDRAAFIRKEQAYGELARSTSFASIIYIFLLIFSSIELVPKLFYGSLSLSISIVFFWRYLQAKSIDGVFVYIIFLLLTLEENKKTSDNLLNSK